MDSALLNELSKSLTTSKSLITDLSDYEKYFHDATDHFGIPDAILMAECETDIIETINFCKINKLKVVPRGAGTGLSGGCVAIEGGILISTERIDHINIIPEKKIAVCGVGVITKDLVDTAEKICLTYPPDPASFDESTLGGNIAENAGGLRCKKYGVTRDYVLGMRGITIDGEIILTGCYNNYQGFNLNDLFIGSEGTLLIITEITVSLIETPLIGDTILAAFSNAEDGAQTVSSIIQNGIIPVVMEFLDGDAAECSNQYEKTEGLDKAGAILLFETSPEDSSQSQKIEKLCNSNNATMIRIENEPGKVDQLWKVRRNLSKASKAIAKVRISEDVVVPVSKLPELVKFVAKMNEASPVWINSFGHAGDGNLHVNFLSQNKSEEILAEIQTQIENLMTKTLELGGSLSGEHGIGIEKKKFLPFEFNKSTIKSMINFKEVFDPENLLNPEKIFKII